MCEEFLLKRKIMDHVRGSSYLRFFIEAFPPFQKSIAFQSNHGNRRENQDILRLLAKFSLGVPMWRKVVKSF
jgi:hypothetical protein